MVLEEPWEFSLGSFSQGLRDGCGATCADQNTGCLVGRAELRTSPQLMW